MTGIDDDGFIPNSFVELKISGHAFYSKKGNDIVCAAVSALFLTAQSALTKLCNLNLECGLTSEFSFIKFNSLECKNNDAFIVLKTVILGFLDIEKNYPSFCKIIIKRR